eukprot:1368792-Amorphochlora_amoeboformis.AAC.1
MAELKEVAYPLPQTLDGGNEESATWLVLVATRGGTREIRSALRTHRERVNFGTGRGGREGYRGMGYFGRARVRVESERNEDRCGGEKGMMVQEGPRHASRAHLQLPDMEEVGGFVTPVPRHIPTTVRE